MTLQLLDQSINKENEILKMVNGGEWLTELKLKVWKHGMKAHAAPSYQPEQKKGQ